MVILAGEMRDYELLTIISPELDEEGMAKTIEKLGKSIEDKGGIVDKIDEWGKKKLAYPLKKFMEGNYILTRFKLKPELVKGIKGEIKSWEEVLRILIVKAED